MRLLKWAHGNALMTALLYVILGLLFVVKPDITMRAACYILSAWLLMAGIAYIVDYFRGWSVERRSNALAIGLLSILAALFLLLKTDAAIAAIPVLLGFSVIASGAIKAQNAIVLYKIGNRAWLAALVGALVCLALGVVLIENPFSAAATLVTAIGAGLLFSGVTDLAVTVLLSRKVKALKSAARAAARPGDRENGV